MKYDTDIDEIIEFLSRKKKGHKLPVAGSTTMVTTTTTNNQRVARQFNDPIPVQDVPPQKKVQRLLNFLTFKECALGSLPVAPDVTPPMSSAKFECSIDGGYSNHTQQVTSQAVVACRDSSIGVPAGKQRQKDVILVIFR